MATDPSIITMPYCFEPRDYQLKIYQSLDSGCKRQFLRWCRRTGKDLTSINYLFKSMLERVGNYYYILPEYSQGRKAIFEGKTKEGRAYIDHMPKQLIKGNINKNEMKFETVNGSLFRIVGGDNYNTSIVGTGFAGCVISEYALQDPELMDFLRPILRESEAWIIVNGTPRGQNHMYKLEQSILGNPSWNVSVIQAMWPDRENYHDGIATTEQIQADMDEGMALEKAEQEYGVSYTAGVHGAYYADCIAKARKENRIGNFPHDDNKWVDTFWDIGKSDSTSIWFRQQDGTRLTWIDFHEDSNKNPVEYVKILQEKGYNYRTHYLPHDANHDNFSGCAKTIIRNCLNSAGISSDVVIAPKPNHKLEAINAVRSRFSRYYFDLANCADGLTKLSLYHRKYDKINQVFMEQPVHDFCSHAADAMSTEALTGDMNEDEMYNNNGNVKIISDFNPWES